MRHGSLTLRARLASTATAISDRDSAGLGAQRADRAGAPGPGDQLPSVRDLAAEAGVNVNTVRAVYARLEREGLVRSEQGRGTFVGRQADAGPTPRCAATFAAG